MPNTYVHSAFRERTESFKAQVRAWETGRCRGRWQLIEDNERAVCGTGSLSGPSPCKGGRDRDCVVGGVVMIRL